MEHQAVFSQSVGVAECQTHNDYLTSKITRTGRKPASGCPCRRSFTILTTITRWGTVTCPTSCPSASTTGYRTLGVRSPLPISSIHGGYKRNDKIKLNQFNQGKLS